VTTSIDTSTTPPTTTTRTTTIQTTTTEAPTETETTTETTTTPPDGSGSSAWAMRQANAENTGTATVSSSPTRGRIKWTAEIGGRVTSSPIVVEDLVIIGGMDGVIHAFDTEDGSTVWTLDAGSNPGAFAYAGGSLYAGTNGGNLYAVEASTGEEQWSRYINYDFKGHPVIHDGLLLAGAKESAVALDPDTGDTKWEFPIRSDRGARVALDEDAAYISDPRGNSIHSVDRSTGDQRWEFGADGGIIFDMSPTVGGGGVYAGNDGGTAYAVDKETGEGIWRASPGRDVYRQSFAYYNGRIYYGRNDHTFYCLDASTGDTVWTFSDDLGNESISHQWTAPGVANDIVYTGYQTGIAFAIDAQTGDEIWRVRTGGIIEHSAFAVTEDAAFTGCWDGNLYAFE